MAKEIDFEVILCGMLTDRMLWCKRQKLRADALYTVALAARFVRVGCLAGKAVHLMRWVTGY